MSTKRGLCYSYPDKLTQAVTTLAPSWCYNWSLHPLSVNGVEAVPMCATPYDQNALSSGVDRVGGYSPYLLCFNEPNVRSQANMYPYDAAIRYHWLSDRYADKRLVSPAPAQVSDLDLLAGQPAWCEGGYMDLFLYEYRIRYGGLPRIDALAIHAYANSCAEIQDIVHAAVLWAWRNYGARLTEYWLTEWAICHPVQSVALAEMDKCLTWLESCAGLTRYSWFEEYFRGNEWWAVQPNTSLLSDLATCALSPYGAMYLSH